MSEDTEAGPGPARAGRDDPMLSCDQARWYPRYRKVALPSEFLPLPADVVAYLRHSPSLVVPVECQAEMVHARSDPDDDASDSDTPSEPWSDSDESDEGESPATPTFPEFTASVRAAMARLGGAVFVQLNWSAPRDATWLGLGRSLRCDRVSQVYLLLKGSQLVARDLRRPAPPPAQPPNSAPHPGRYSLVLKAWTEINPGHEFRCLVRGGRLVAIGQRDITAYFEFIRADRANICRDLQSFFLEYLAQSFPLTDFVFDVVRDRKDHVTLLDLAPWGPPTDALLFDWDELVEPPDNRLHLETTSPEFRYVTHQAGIQPNGLGRFGMPQDMVDLSTGADPAKLIDFLKLQTSSGSNSG